MGCGMVWTWSRGAGGVLSVNVKCLGAVGGSGVEEDDSKSNSEAVQEV